ncbi:MAG: DUF309 domain-containing protein [Acidobacteriia bacterium]|nr:DUF309 domain-containing protein [Terriglobia bacterium]
MHLDEYARGIALFNQARFFESHEVLEDMWRAAPAAEKKFLQGMVQTAVAFHHYSTGNRVGMRSVLDRAIGNLAEDPGRFGEVDLPLLRKSLNQWREAMDKERPLPPLPRIELLQP